MTDQIFPVLEAHGRTPLLAMRAGSTTGKVLTYLDVHDVEKLTHYHEYGGPRNMSSPDVVPILLHINWLISKRFLDWQTPEYQETRRTLHGEIVCSPTLPAITALANVRADMMTMMGKSRTIIPPTWFFDEYIDTLIDADHESRELIRTRLSEEMITELKRLRILTFHGYPSKSLQRDLHDRRTRSMRFVHLIDVDVHAEDPHAQAGAKAYRAANIQVASRLAARGEREEAIAFLDAMPRRHNRHLWAPDATVHSELIRTLSRAGYLYRDNGDALSVTWLGEDFLEFMHQNARNLDIIENLYAN